MDPFCATKPHDRSVDVEPVRAATLIPIEARRQHALRQCRGEEQWVAIQCGLHDPAQLTTQRRGFRQLLVALDLCAQIGRATSELQSLMRISYAVFCLKKKKKRNTQSVQTYHIINIYIKHTTTK